MTELRLRGEGLEWREVGGEIVALDTGGSTYLGANRAGALLWSALAAGTTREGLIAVLKDEFDLDDAVATADVDRFLEELRAQSLLDEG